MVWWSLYLVLLAAPSTAAQPNERLLGWKSYIELVNDYRDGTVDWASARHLLTQRRPVALVVGNLRAAPLPARDLKAAVLLHTEIASLYVDPGAERTRDFQMEIAERILPLVNEESFSRTWHFAAGYLYQSVLSPGQASYHLDKLHAPTPDDVELLLARGMVQETLGAFELSKIPRWSHSNPTFAQKPREKRRVSDITKIGRQRLFEAIAWYTKAIGRDPSSAMARLRRGHCYSMLGKPFEASKDLTEAKQLGDERYETGLASLFLGQLHREQGNFDEAVTQYRQAVKNLPEWQVGYFGLSEALSSAGQRNESRATLEQGLRAPVRPKDPKGGLWQYYLRMDAFSDLVTELRAQVIR